MAPATISRISRDDARGSRPAAQASGRPRPRRVAAGDIRRTIRRLGLLQIDFVNVLVPAHYQVPFPRLVRTTARSWTGSSMAG
jgi:uncharacterized protein YcaQ